MWIAVALLTLLASGLGYLYLAALRRADGLAAERDALRARLQEREEDRARLGARVPGAGAGHGGVERGGRRRGLNRRRPAVEGRGELFAIDQCRAAQAEDHDDGTGEQPDPAVHPNDGGAHGVRAYAEVQDPSTPVYDPRMQSRQLGGT